MGGNIKLEEREVPLAKNLHRKNGVRRKGMGKWIELCRSVRNKKTHKN